MVVVGIMAWHQHQHQQEMLWEMDKRRSPMPGWE
jgi:hypothetical protein